MFKTRVISSVVLVALTLGIIIIGGPLLCAVMCLVSIRGMWELYRVLKVHDLPIAFTGYAACILHYLDLYFLHGKAFVLICISFLIVLLGFYVFSYPTYATEQFMTVYFGFFYVAVMLSYIYQTRIMENGAYIVWLIFLCSWISDTFAYLTGSVLGKHKMAPVLSPKKSVEGAIGGIVASILLTGLYCYLFRNHTSHGTQEIVMLALFAGVGACISMIGDLAASAIKRNYDIKDYGRIIPGHGGILDRFDSVIITAPIIYFLSNFVMYLQK